MENEVTFKELNISNEILKAITNMGYEVPSEVQRRVIPEMMYKNDIIIKAKTGTGKTAAYGIPIGESIVVENNCIQALILTPTRELALQISKELNEIFRFKRAKAETIYGGEEIETQRKKLKQRIHVIVGTPGRILDHIARGNLDFSRIKQLVIDEADEMFNMGFIEDVKAIIAALPKSRQTVLASATISNDIYKLAGENMNSAREIFVEEEKVSVEEIEQKYYIVSEEDKFDSLKSILNVSQILASIIFCNTRNAASELNKKLKKEGYNSACLHGEMTQEERIRAINNFKKGEFKYLVATDVAARGIDIPSVTHVINYDIPRYSESYIHRIGRTGRAGKSGTAITFVVPEEIKYLKLIEEFISQEIPQIQKLEYDTDYKEEQTDIINHNEDKNEYFIDKKADKSNEITRLHINLGRKNKLRPGDIVGAITANTELSSDYIGVIEIYDNYAFVDIMGGYGELIIDRLAKCKIKGKNVKIQKAKKRE